MKKKIDLHMHSILSDGELFPFELARRASVLDYETIAITDHVDSSNVSSIAKLADVIDDINDYWDINVICGAEVTHVPIEIIDNVAKKAREYGAEIIIVHGETLAESVVEGTNLEAVKSKNIDILAHPGIITINEGKIAKKNNIFLEISARKGHCLANGHVAKVANEVGADLVINTDTHSPSDLITLNKAWKIGLGAGLNEKQTETALLKNPIKILKKRNLI